MKKTFDILLTDENYFNEENAFSDYFLNDEEESLKYLPKSNVINILIGSNNSGKSRFMRHLMKCKNLVGVSNHKNIDKFIISYNEQVEEFNKSEITLPREKARLRYISEDDKKNWTL